MDAELRVRRQQVKHGGGKRTSHEDGGLQG